MDGKRPSPNRPHTPQDRPTTDVPWEALQKFGFFGGVVQTVKRVMLHPALFFRTMPVGAGIGRPLAFYVLITLFSAIMDMLWSNFGVHPMQLLQSLMAGGSTELPGGNLEQLAAPMSPVSLLLYPVAAVITVFIFSGLTHVFLSIFKAASSGFEGTFRAICYTYATYALTMVPLLGWLLVIPWFMVVLVVSLKNIHDGSYLKVVGALVLELVLMFFLVLQLAVYMSGLAPGA